MPPTVPKGRACTTGLTDLIRDGWCRGLLVRRSLSKPDKLTYYLTFAPEGTSTTTLVRVAGTRWTLEIGQIWCLRNYIGSSSTGSREPGVQTRGAACKARRRSSSTSSAWIIQTDLPSPVTRWPVITPLRSHA